tara:strand:- start:638 stop:862 length:225 start_codon:yes stop_codon:yes gene_type:complete
MKSIFSTASDVITGLTGVLAGLVTIGIMTQIIFGAGALGLDIVTNISSLVNTFTSGGLTGLLTLLVVCALWTNK